MARSFLWSHAFTSTLEKEIWSLHAEGKSLRAISAELRKGGHKMFKDKIHAVVKGLRDEMLGRTNGKITIQLSISDFIKAKVKR